MMTSLVVEHHKRGIISAFLLCVTHAYFSYDAFGLQKDPVQAVEIELREVADALKKVEMEIEAVSIDLKKLEKKISEVEVEIQDAKKAGDKEELTYLRDEKNKLLGQRNAMNQALDRYVGLQPGCIMDMGSCGLYRCLMNE